MQGQRTDSGYRSNISASSFHSLAQPRVDDAHGGVEKQPIAGIDEEQRLALLREEIVGADGRDDEAERHAKGGQYLHAKVEIGGIGRERMRQRPRGDQAEGKGAAVDCAHIARLDLLLGQPDRAHPFLAHDGPVPDAADQKSGQRGDHHCDPVHIEYVHVILPVLLRKAQARRTMPHGLRPFIRLAPRFDKRPPGGRQ